MTKRIVALAVAGGSALLLTASLLTSAAIAQPIFQEGLYQITYKMDVKSSSGAAVADVTFNECLTGQHQVPSTGPTQENCAIQNLTITGHKAKWQMQCSSLDGTRRSEADIEYKGNKFEGKLVSRREGPSGKQAVLVQQIRGKRIGACP